MLGDGVDQDPGRAVTESAASVKVGGAEPDEIGIAEPRRLDRVGVPGDGMAHAELEEIPDERPVTLASGDI
jgi:hypothetical protein